MTLLLVIRWTNVPDALSLADQPGRRYWMHAMPRAVHQFGPNGEIREAFNAFDRNGDGLVSIEELLKLMVQIGEDMTREEAEDALRRADMDGDGQLSFDEFIAFMLSVK